MLASVDASSLPSSGRPLSRWERKSADTFAGIAPAGVPAFVLAQVAAALLAHGAGAWLPDRWPASAALAAPVRRRARDRWRRDRRRRGS